MQDFPVCGCKGTNFLLSLQTLKTSFLFFHHRPLPTGKQTRRFRTSKAPGHPTRRQPCAPLQSALRTNGFSLAHKRFRSCAQTVPVLRTKITRPAVRLSSHSSRLIGNNRRHAGIRKRKKTSIFCFYSSITRVFRIFAVQRQALTWNRQITRNSVPMRHNTAQS